MRGARGAFMKLGAVRAGVANDAQAFQMTESVARLPTEVQRNVAAKSSRKLDRFGVPGWVQAMPFGLVFAVFFVVPLTLVVIVSFWDYNDYEMIPAFIS